MKNTKTESGKAILGFFGIMPILARPLGILVCLILFINGSVFADSGIPERIRIGLQYGSGEAASLQLEGYGEIGFGQFFGTDFLEITRFPGVRQVTVSRDYTWHVRIGDPTRDAALYAGRAAVVTPVLPGAYGGYEEGWNLFYGDFLTESEAQFQLQTLQQQFPELSLSVTGPSQDRIRVLEGNRLLWIYDCNEAEYALREVGQEPYLLKFNGVAYRGGLMVRRFAGSDLTLINTVPVEEYLYGVLPKEMHPEWPLEALKAQAVAARNYAVISQGKHQRFGFDLCATPDCQVYGGYRVESPLCRQAVEETRGRLLMYDGQPVQAFFHSNSGGRTENSENVWSAAVPYLRGVEDSFSVGAPNTDWTRVYSKPELERLLAAQQMTVGTLQDVVISRKSDNGRVLTLTFRGTSGEVVLTKEQARKVLGYNELKSTWYELSGSGSVRGRSSDGSFEVPASAVAVGAEGLPLAVTVAGAKARTVNGTTEVVLLTGDTIAFTGHGWGHGLGLSQWGAKKMAELGYTYEQILSHYYTGVTLE